MELKGGIIMEKVVDLDSYREEREENIKDQISEEGELDSELFNMLNDLSDHMREVNEELDRDLKILGKKEKK